MGSTVALTDHGVDVFLPVAPAGSTDAGKGGPWWSGVRSV